MAKYIIDIPDEGKYRLGHAYIFGNDGERIVASCNVTDLTPYTDLDRKAIEDEVWDFASMLMNMHPDVAEDIYLSMNGGKGIGVAAEMTYSEAKAIYESWKADKDKICVGDELEQTTVGGIHTGTTCVVVKIDGDKMNGIRKDGSVIVCSSQVKRWWRKTGRSFPEVSELLKKMGGGNNV